MVVVDASCLASAIVGGRHGEVVRTRLATDTDQIAPHIIDVEVFGVIRRHFLQNLLDPTAAGQAVEDLRDWPAERVGHRHLLERAWDLRETVRGWDAMYVALAESFDAPLLTADRRLARAPNLRCAVEVVAEP